MQINEILVKALYSDAFEYIDISSGSYWETFRIKNNDFVLQFSKSNDGKLVLTDHTIGPFYFKAEDQKVDHCVNHPLSLSIFTYTKLKNVIEILENALRLDFSDAVALLKIRTNVSHSSTGWLK